MSYIAIPDPILFSKSLSDGAKLLYGLVKRYVDIGECFATNAHFAEILNCSESSIKRYLRELVSQGYITSNVNRKGRENTSRILSISGYIEVGSKMNLPSNQGRVKNDPKVGSEMTHVLTEINNRNNTPIIPCEVKTKKPKRNTKLEKQKFAQSVKEQWHKSVVQNGIKQKSTGIGVTDTDINNIQRIIKYTTDEGSSIDYKNLDAWLNYFNELFRICKRKIYLKKCIKSFSWSVKPTTYQKLGDDTYLNLDEVA
jgi:ribosomal protein S18